MTRQQRRAAARKGKATIADFHTLCAGYFEGAVITPVNMRAWILRARWLDPTAVAACQGIGAWLREASSRLRDSGFMCLACEHQFNGDDVRPMGFAVAVPFADPRAVMITGICADCALRDDLGELALACWRMVWPLAPVDSLNAH